MTGLIRIFTTVMTVGKPYRKRNFQHKGLPHHVSEALPVMNTAVHNLVTQSLVYALGKLIVDEGIGGHLHALVTTRPLLRLGKQVLAYAPPAVILAHVPALDVPHRLCWVATVGMRTQVDFQKTDQGSVAGFGDQDGQRHREYGSRVGPEEESEFSGVFADRRLRPQRLEQRRQLVDIGRLRSSDVNVVHEIIVDDR